MKIQKNKLNYDYFASVPIGGVFTFNGDYYMRIALYESYNAIDLETTQLKIINADTSIIPINGSFIEE